VVVVVAVVVVLVAVPVTMGTLPAEAIVTGKRGMERREGERRQQVVVETDRIPVLPPPRYSVAASLTLLDGSIQASNLRGKGRIGVCKFIWWFNESWRDRWVPLDTAAQ